MPEISAAGDRSGNLIKDVRLIRAEKQYLRALRVNETDAKQAWGLISDALEIEPTHAEANNLAGYLWQWEWERIGYADHSHLQATRVALGYFERALECEPRFEDAWGGKAYAHLTLEEYDTALSAALKGIELLPLRVGHQMSDPEVFRLVAEELYDIGIRAYLALGLTDQAEQLRSEGLWTCPGSTYLQESGSRAS